MLSRGWPATAVEGGAVALRSCAGDQPLTAFTSRSDADLRGGDLCYSAGQRKSNGICPVRHRVSKPHGLSACLKEAGRREEPVPTLYPERVLLKLRAGTCANISTVLKPGLTRAEFIRLAIDEKIAQPRREAGIGVERGVETAVIGRDQTVGMISCPDMTDPSR